MKILMKGVATATVKFVNGMPGLLDFLGNCLRPSLSYKLNVSVNLLDSIFLQCNMFLLMLVFFFFFQIHEFKTRSSILGMI